MAVLKKRQTGKTLAAVIAVVMLLAIAVPAVSAYEAHMVNVTVRVEHQFDDFGKTMWLVTDVDEIQTFLDLAVSMEIPNFPYPPTYPNVGVTDPANVPINTFILWVVRIVVPNPNDYPMTEVVLKDNFSAELGGVPLGTDVVDLFVKSHSRGKHKKEIFETQYRITWYVTCIEPNPNPEDPEVCLNNGGWLLPGASDYLDIYVWTKLNPAGWQSYTSEGCYTMNSGPNLKWLDDAGQQFSLDGEPLYVKTTGFSGACP